MNALVLVDLQNDFLPGGALAVPGGDEVIAVANRAQQHFDLIVATQDWHPPDHGSFAENHPGHSVGETIELDGLPQILWPAHCVQDTRGAEFAPELNTSRVRRVFQKGTDPRIDSYSGFYDNARRRSTGLGEYLREQQVTDVYILGLATDYCVKYTALDASQLGFNTFVIEDGCRGVHLQPDDTPLAVEEMRSQGVEVIHSREFPAVEVIAESRQLRLVRRDGWEFVQRTTAAGVVIILALTGERKVLFIEQYRKPVGGRVIEFPAGLAGDSAEFADEPLENAADRELLEETGYRAESVTPIFRGPSSAGLTDETVTFFLATGLQKVAAGGGVEGEDITLHEIPLDEADDWLQSKMQQGCFVGARVYAGLFFLLRDAAK